MATVEPREALGYANRLPATFAAATGTLSAVTNMTAQPFTNSVGTNENIQGAFIVTGTGAVPTKASTAGVLFTEGLFSMQSWTLNN
jgi:hypothetical protein